ncbi:hypothetical protein ARMGADRAFT_1134740 [Armillaria gallica]|uniref:Helitron helicase-like domain-containing protein n=1 Tax=Armillaria gallica TaxID=47427 RepID=A0A2H3E2T6_ARMGA|nr:hypothetical protein ARMGADRAFT_1134740 [Armillaria gallica]
MVHSLQPFTQDVDHNELMVSYPDRRVHSECSHTSRDDVFGAVLHLQAQHDDLLPGHQPYHDLLSCHDLGEMLYKCPFCHALHWYAKRVTRKIDGNIVFGVQCCRKSQVVLPPACEPPLALRQLLEANDAQAKDYRDRMWMYNRAFSFTSLGVNEDHSVNLHQCGPPVFRIQGELYHCSGSLLPSCNQAPSYAQLYIYEPRDSIDHCCHNNYDLWRDTIMLLETILRTHHQYALIYCYAAKILEQYGDSSNKTITLCVDLTSDKHTYNLPTADEVAVILPDCSSLSEYRDIILHRWDGPLKCIHSNHPAYAPLQYVLLFPYGENGWHPELRLNQPKAVNPSRLTLLQYVSHQLQVRHNVYSTILHGHRLL